MAKVKIGNKRVNKYFGDIIIKLNFSSETEFVFNLKENHHYDCMINWNNTEHEYINYYEISSSFITHTYQSGVHYLKINGLCESIDFNSNGHIMDIISWGQPDITKLKHINFNGCVNLTDLTNEYGGLKLIEKFDDVFNGCVSIKKVPEKLFNYNTTVTSFNNTFKNCTSLAEIPEKLFVDCVSVTQFSNTFENCILLTEIPEKLFEKNTNVENFSSTFSNTNITEIPEKLFDKNINATNFSSIFSNTDITTIPNTLFNNTTNVTNFSSTFDGCQSLIGCSPEIWDDSIWTNVINYTSCFNNCTGLYNYSYSTTNLNSGFISASTHSFTIGSGYVPTNPISVNVYINSTLQDTSDIVSLTGGGTKTVVLDNNIIDGTITEISFNYNSCGNIIPSVWK